MSSTSRNTGVIQVLTSHRHEMVCDLLEWMLSDQPDIEATCIRTGTDEVVRAVREHAPDVVVLDPESPGVSPFDACRTIRSISSGTAVLFLGADPSDSLVEQALRAGCSGYLTAHNPSTVVLEAVRMLAQGGQVFCQTVRDRIVIDSRAGAWLEGRRTRISTLSQREAEVLRYIAQGLTKREMAEQMHISVKTVDNHASSLMRKLDIHNRVELTRFAIRERMVEI